MQVGAVSSATVVLGSVFPGRTIAELSDQETLVTYYSRRKVANLSRLNVDEPYSFNYPHEGPHTSAMLIRRAQTPAICGATTGTTTSPATGSTYPTMWFCRAS
jgi:hypothetical protein